MARGFASHGRSEKADGYVRRVRAMKADGAAFESYAAAEPFGKELDALSWQEARYVHRTLGLAKGGEAATAAVAVRAILDHLVPPVGHRLAADTKSADVVRTVANFNAERRAARVANAARLEAVSAAVGNYWNELGRLPEGPEREAFRAANEPEQTRLGEEAMALADATAYDVAKDRERLCQLIAAPDPAGWTITNANATKEQRAAVATATDFYAKVLSRAGGPETVAAVTLRKTATRARARRESEGAGSVWLSSGDAATAVHELAHHIEFHAPGVAGSAFAFLTHRVKDEKLQSLKALFPAHNYEAGEKGRQDDFGKYFGAGDHRAYYCGKDYGDGTTEIVSMGCEYLFKDPAGFCEKDPEFAQFIVGVLRGTMR
jgi:hypothetical protein